MSRHLDSQFIFDSRQGFVSPPSAAFTVDLAENPSAAHRLIKLGISPRKDLPAVLLSDAADKLRLVGLRLDAEEAVGLVDGQDLPPVDRVVLYGATWCPDCRIARRILREAELPYDEIDLDTDEKSEVFVVERSGGRRVVPTLLLGERVFLFNPDPSLLERLVDAARRQRQSLLTSS